MKKKGWMEIIRESIAILILASLISSIGGFGASSIRDKFLNILPLIIMLPALNDMSGDFGTIISSKFTTLLYLGYIKKGTIFTAEFKRTMTNVLWTGIFCSFYVTVLASIISVLKGFEITPDLSLKLFIISITTVLTLIFVMMIVVTNVSFYLKKRNMDLDNVLIPLATSFADFSSMLVLSVLTSVLL